MNSLAGKRVVVTRAPHQAEELASLLRERGAIPLLYPCIDILPPEDPAELDAAILRASQGGFDWLVLTSANTVYALSKRIAALGLKTPFAGLRLAAVGPASAKAARDYLGLETAVLPEKYMAEGLADSLQQIAGARVFLPHSALADDTLAQRLRNSGADVTAVDAYRTVTGSGGAELLTLFPDSRFPTLWEVDTARFVKARLTARGYTFPAITLTSASAVDGLLERFAREGGQTAALSAADIACIGPKTEERARQQGLRVTVVPREHTLEGMVAALEAYYAH